MHHYTRAVGWNAHLKLLATYNNWRSRIPEGGGTACLGLDCRSVSIPRYTNALTMVFMTERTVVATGGRFFNMVFSDNTCQALLADQMGSFNMAAGLVVSHKKAIKKIEQTTKYTFLLSNLTLWTLNSHPTHSTKSDDTINLASKWITHDFDLEAF